MVSQVISASVSLRRRAYGRGRNRARRPLTERRGETVWKIELGPESAPQGIEQHEQPGLLLEAEHRKRRRAARKVRDQDVHPTGPPPRHQQVRPSPHLIVPLVTAARLPPPDGADIFTQSAVDGNAGAVQTRGKGPGDDGSRTGTGAGAPEHPAEAGRRGPEKPRAERPDKASMICGFARARLAPERLRGTAGG